MDFLHSGHCFIAWHFSWNLLSGSVLSTALHFLQDNFDRYFKIVPWPDVDGTASFGRRFRDFFGVVIGGTGDFAVEAFVLERWFWLAVAGGDSFTKLLTSTLLTLDRRLWREVFDRFMVRPSAESFRSCTVLRRLFFSASLLLRIERSDVAGASPVIVLGARLRNLLESAFLFWFCASPVLALSVRWCDLFLSAFLSRFWASPVSALATRLRASPAFEPARLRDLPVSVFLTRFCDSFVHTLSVRLRDILSSAVLARLLPTTFAAIAELSGTLSARASSACWIEFVPLLSGALATPFSSAGCSASAAAVPNRHRIYIVTANSNQYFIFFSSFSFVANLGLPLWSARYFYLSEIEWRHTNKFLRRTVILHAIEMHRA